MSRPTLEVADIVRQHGKDFIARNRHRLSWQQLKVLRAIERCRTAALGGHRDRCPRCGPRAISYNSCRNRHCPKCLTHARDRWLADREKELLNVGYFHVVFTLPEELSELTLRNQKVIYQLLFRTSAASLLEVAADPRHLGAQIQSKREALVRPKPAIVVTDRQLGDLTAQALYALYKANVPPKLFVRAGELVRLRWDEKGKPTIESLTDSILRKHMSDAANFFKESRQGQTAIIPPMSVAKNILAQEGWQLPPLSCVVEIPVLRPDGSIIDKPGYDRSTGVYYWPDRSLSLPPMPKNPSAKDIKQALDFLLETIGEFPYVDAASRANALALLLTPLIRQAIQGVVPIALIDAVNQGTGKSLLSDVISLIPTGRTASMATM